MLIRDYTDISDQKQFGPNLVPKCFDISALVPNCLGVEIGISWVRTVDFGTSDEMF